MPLPWKKAKSKRFSQLVTNHLQPPQRGGSLVVETGFPTSLADLFVKNRERLKKKKKKNNKSNPIQISSAASPPPPLTISVPSSNCPSNPSTNLPASSNFRPPKSSSVLPISPLHRLPFPSGKETAPAALADAGNSVNSHVVNRNRVFLGILKMFFVVILALGTKKFAVGITMSAFLLLLMEYAGEHVGALLKPLAKAQELIRLLVEGFSCLAGIEKHKSMVVVDTSYLETPIAKVETNRVDPFRGIQVVQSNPNLWSPKMSDLIPYQEIQIVESNSDLGSSKMGDFIQYEEIRSVRSSPNLGSSKMNDLDSEIQTEQPSSNLVPLIQKIPSVKYEFDSRSCKETRVSEEMRKKREDMEKERALTYTTQVVNGKNGSSRRGKIRSKIKKYAKKLNGSMAKPKEPKSDASGLGRENKLCADEQREYEENGQQYEAKFDYIRTLLASRGENDDDNDDGPVNVEAISRSSEISLGDVEEYSSNNRGLETVERKSEMNSGCLVIFVVVLAGLVGGRILALAFTFSWCVLPKVGTVLRCRKGVRDNVSVASSNMSINAFYYT